MITRRLFTAFSLLVLLMQTGSVQAFFSDTGTSPYASAILGLEERSIIEGYSDGTFRPSATINRAEFLKILMEARFPNQTPSDLRCFADLEVKTPQWYAVYVCAAYELGIISGYPDGTFRPDTPVNLAEALKMSMLTFGMTGTPVPYGAWYETYLQMARDLNILLPLLKNPSHFLTRGEMASLTQVLIDEHEYETNHPEPGNAVCGNGVKEQFEQCDDGNTQDSDGCSSICILVSEPIRRAVVQIDQQTTGVLTTVAQGQTDVALLKFTAVAGRQDAILTDVTFDAAIGSLLYAQHYELVMDRDGDGIYERIAQSEGKVTQNRLTFDKILGGGIVLPKGLIIPFLVRADLTAANGPVSLGLKFATSLPDYVQAQGAVDGYQLEGVETNGACTAPNCFIRVNTMGSTNLSVQLTGNLYVTKDSSTVRSHILLGGTVTDELLRLRLHAESDSIDLKTIRIDGVPSSVDALLLYRAAPGQSASGSPFAQASHGQCPEQSASRFCAELGLRTFVVSPTEDTVIVMKAQMKSDQFGGASGQMFQPIITGAVSGDNAAIEARSVSSSGELAQNDNDSTADGEIFIGIATPGSNTAISGQTNDTSLASIGSVLNDGPAEGSSIPSGFTPFARFKISALPHGNSFHGSNDVLLQTLTFRVTAQNVQLDPASVSLSTANDLSNRLNCTAGASTGTFNVTCTGMSDTLQNRIAQGQDVVYVLSANVTNTQVTPGTSILSASLAILGQRGMTNSIVWTDQETTFQWVDVPQTSVDGTVYRR